jgi:hypothetical protein
MSSRAVCDIMASRVLQDLGHIFHIFLEEIDVSEAE